MKHKYFPSTRMKKCCYGGEKKIWAFHSNIISGLVSNIGFLRYSRNQLYFFGNVKDRSEVDYARADYGKFFIYYRKDNSYAVIMPDGTQKNIVTDYERAIHLSGFLSQPDITYPYSGNRYICIGPEIYYFDENKERPILCATNRGLDRTGENISYSPVESNAFYAVYYNVNTAYHGARGVPQLLANGSLLEGNPGGSPSFFFSQEYASYGRSWGYGNVYHLRTPVGAWAGTMHPLQVVAYTGYALLHDGAYNPGNLLYGQNIIANNVYLSSYGNINSIQGFIRTNNRAYFNGSLFPSISSIGKTFSIITDTVYAGGQFANRDRLAYLKSPATYVTGDDFDLVFVPVGNNQIRMTPGMTGNYIVYFSNIPTIGNRGERYVRGEIKQVYWEGKLVREYGGDTLMTGGGSGLPDMLVLGGTFGSVIYRGEIVYEGSGSIVGFCGNNVAIYEGNKLTIFNGSDQIYERQHNLVQRIDVNGRNDTRLFLRVDDKIFIVDDDWGLLRFPIANIGIV